MFGLGTQEILILVLLVVLIGAIAIVFLRSKGGAPPKQSD
jgi:hypothetical protein